MIVEDLTIVAKPMARILAAAGACPVIVATLSEACRAAEREPWDLMLVDLLLPDGNGRVLIREVVGRRARTGVVAMSGSLDLVESVDLYEMGAVVFHKDETPDLVAIGLMAMNRAARIHGEVLGSEPGRPSVVKCPAVTAVFAGCFHLSPREREVLELLVAGLSPKLIAGRIGRADVTVRRHIEEACRKCGVENQRELLALFARSLLDERAARVD